MELKEMDEELWRRIEELANEDELIYLTKYDIDLAKALLELKKEIIEG